MEFIIDLADLVISRQTTITKDRGGEHNRSEREDQKEGNTGEVTGTDMYRPFHNEMARWGHSRTPTQLDRDGTAGRSSISSTTEQYRQ